MLGFPRIRPLILALIGVLILAAVACDRDVAQESEPMAEPSVERSAEPTAEPAAAAGPPIYQMGIFAEPISRNFWNFYGGPAGSVWTGYVLAGWATTLYGYSDQRFEWVPAAAADFPTDLKKETIDGEEFWTTEVTMKKGLLWSDGEEITAEDVVFTVTPCSIWSLAPTGQAPSIALSSIGWRLSTVTCSRSSSRRPTTRATRRYPV